MPYFLTFFWLSVYVENMSITPYFHKSLNKVEGKVPGGVPVFMRYFTFFAVRHLFLAEACLSLLCQFYVSNDRKFKFSKVNSKD